MMHLKSVSRQYILIIILLLALGVRALVFREMMVDSTRFFQKDSGGYHKLAVNLLEFGQFSRTPLAEGGTLEVNRTPLYPGFLAATYAVFGIRPAAAILVQLLISTTTIALAYRLAQLWSKPRIAILLILLMSLETSHIFYANQIMTETFFCFLLLAGLVMWSSLIKHKRLIYGVASGCLFGLGALTRPVLFYFSPVATVATLALMTDNKRKRFRAAFSVLLMVSLTVSPWIIRNYQVTGQAMRISVNQSIFIRDVVVQMRAYQQDVAHSSIREQLACELESETSEATRQDPAKLAAHYERKFTQEILENWKDYLFIHLRGSVQVFIMPTANVVARALGWLQPGQGTGLLVNFMNRGVVGSLQAFWQFYRQLPDADQGEMLLLFGLAGYEMTFLAALNLGMLIGIWRCFCAKRWRFLVFSIIIIGYFAGVTGPIGFDARYRLPLMSCAILLALQSVATAPLRSGIYQENPKSLP